MGKTSLIQRFCRDTFKEAFATTIGVDFQVKMLNIDGRIIALQLWDTVKINYLIFLRSYSRFLFFFRQVKKGSRDQKIKLCIWFFPSIRFRSITKQYFRKSDGIILVYDISSEITFRNVREWISSVQVFLFQLFSQITIRYLGNSRRRLCYCSCW